MVPDTQSKLRGYECSDRNDSGYVSSYWDSHFWARALFPFIYPTDTAGAVRSCSTIGCDGSGEAVPATAYELLHVDSTCAIVEEHPILYEVIWKGIVAAAALSLVAVLAFTPAAVLMSKHLKSRVRSGI